MKYLYFLFSFLLVSNSHAQFWEPTGGPGGDRVKSATVAENGDIYLVAQSIHRSTDHGSSWKRIPTSMPINAEHNTVKIVCTQSNTLLFANGVSGLWRSSDDGESWTKMFGVGQFPDIAVSPKGYVIVSTGNDVLISADNGLTWKSSKPSEEYRPERVFVDKDGIMYVVVYHNFLFRSLDNGQTWLKVLNGIPTNEYAETWIYPSTDDLSIAIVTDEVYTTTDSGRVWSFAYKAGSGNYIPFVCSVSADTLFLTTASRELHRSLDGGKTWAPYHLSPEYIKSEIAGLFSVNHDLYFLYQTTLLKLDLQTETWERLLIPNGIVSILIATRSGSIIAGTSRPWNFKDDIWTDEPGYVAISALAVDSSDVLCAIVNGKIQMSTDYGKSWQTLIGLLGERFQIAATKNHTFISSDKEGVFRSSDHGLTWDLFTSGMTDKVISAVAATSDIVYAGGNQILYRSSDFGQTWQEQIFPFISGSGKITSMTAFGLNVIVGINRTGVYFSTDNGVMWENHSEGLGLDTIHQLLGTPNGTVFAATNSGVYEYAPADKKWTYVTEDDLPKPILSLALGKDGKVYVGTNGNGVYRTTKTYGIWLDVAEDNNSSTEVSIYPNPASTEFTINFQADKPSSFRTIIYNLLGEAVLTSINEDLMKVNSLRAGQYFLRITADGFERTLPLIIQR